MYNRYNLVAKVKLIRRGVKEVNKAFRKKELGYIKFKLSLCIIAGDVSPVDVVSHFPILCEKNNVPYVYIRSRESLGENAQTKRPTSIVMLLKPAEDNKYRENFDKLLSVARKMNPYINDE